jgi:hypothetical protein
MRAADSFSEFAADHGEPVARRETRSVRNAQRVRRSKALFLFSRLMDADSLPT